ncbi:MAG: PHP domain-containing protein [Candidatus Omnitrophica bacterium]|nr:PHP domain-containing protein [Candidatus Omnitrophota bacterium]
MSERYADLHIHTHYSDSTDSPLDVVQKASQAGLSVISICDHDTIDGILPAREAARGAALEVISGIELSSEYDGKDIHILGYFFNLESGPLVGKLKDMQASRVLRMKKMVAKLHELGVKNITFEEVAELTKSDAVGRLHLAKLLVSKKVVPSLEMAFERFLAEGAAVYFPKYQQTPHEAIRLIKDSGGIAVMAHPMLTQRDELIPALVGAGLDGLEAYYPNCSMEIVNFYIHLAEKHKLIVTGGSDAHGAGKFSTYIGKSYITSERVAAMKERAGVSL